MAFLFVVLFFKEIVNQLRLFLKINSVRIVKQLAFKFEFFGYQSSKLSPTALRLVCCCIVS